MAVAIVELRGERFELRDDVLAPFRAELDALGRAERTRVVYAAAHIVLRGNDGEEIDWPATEALRTRLDAHGFGIAEAMDTAQRFELAWPDTERLLASTARAGLTNGFVGGAGADHVREITNRTRLIDAVLEQVERIHAAHGLPIVLPLPWLPRSGADEADYVEVYGAIARGFEGPLLVHWLGPAFHPEMEHYFPGTSFETILRDNPERIRGAKLSLLDAPREVRIRRAALARDQIVLTGDDFSFGSLLRGGEATEAGPVAAPLRWTEIGGRRFALGDFSHGLLGIFDAIAAPAALALRFLDHGNARRAQQLFGPCEALSRRVFEPPTSCYKAGLAFLAWLNGWQENPRLIGALERARDLAHYTALARLASAAGVLEDAPLAAERLATL